MAAITSATTGTSIADVSQSEIISRLVRMAAQRPYLWRGVAHVPPLLVGTDTYRHAYWPQLTAAAAHTETDQASVEELTPTKNDVTTAAYTRAVVLGDRAKRLSTQDLLAVGVNRTLDAAYNKIDSAVLTLAASMANSVGSAATNHTAANLNSVLAGFRSTCKSSELPPVMICSVASMRDLGGDLATNGAALFGSAVGPQLHAAVTGPNQGIFREFAGFFMGETDGVVAGDTTGKSNFIAHIGEMDCAIAVAFGAAPNVELARQGDRKADWVVAEVDFGAGIVNQGRCYRFITRA
jgi:hypothetical protein